MKLDLKRFLDVPSEWAIRFSSSSISEDDAQRGIEAARIVLDAANVHPFTAFIAHEFLKAEWQEFLADRMQSSGLEEWGALCAWADVWEAAEIAAVYFALNHLPIQGARYHFHVEFPNAPVQEDRLYVRDPTGKPHAPRNRFGSYLTRPGSNH